jgi:stage II sporulation protein D
MNLKPILAFVTVTIFLVLILPALLVLPFSGDEKEYISTKKENPKKQDEPVIAAPDPSIDIAVFRYNADKIETVDLEDYIIGVVASEMPAEFEEEALKAQALTARTYILRQLMYPSDIKLPEGADVTDTVYHQVYRNYEDYKKLWGDDYEWKIARVKQAVYATSGEILTYNDEPITASFFSTSNGYTVNSEDYWENSFPYLRSVASPWDVSSPRFTKTITISKSDFEKKLGISLPNGNKIGSIVSRTSGDRIGEVIIGGKSFTGREVRQKLELHSTDFTWQRSGNEITITTKGYGHGVGMSQYGANGMALEGKTYKEIVNYYYQGVKISSIDSFLPGAKKKK